MSSRSRASGARCRRRTARWPSLFRAGRGGNDWPTVRPMSSIVIVGAGPNLGLAIARRFGREGLAVGLVSRDQAKLDGLVEQLEAEGIQAAGGAVDIREPGALAGAIGALADRLGAVEVLEYSPLPAPEFMQPIL